MKMLRKKILDSGFTLVELMVVVAIIGLLSAVAIPNFKKYQAKSKTSEAKLQLAAIYTAETAFNSDFDTYHFCLAYMGYNPSNEANSRYYTTGFRGIDATAHTIATTNGADGTNCGNTPGEGTTYFSGAKKIGSTSAYTGVPSVAALGGVIPQAFETTFTAAAVGYIDKNFTTTATMDAWIITDTKQLTQKKNGY